MEKIDEEIAELETSANAQRFQLAIATGEMDAHLDGILDTIIQRRQILKAQRANVNRATLRAGDPVVILPNIRPAYLGGVDGVVREIKDGKIYVTLGPMRGGPKFRSGMTVGFPASCVAGRP